MTQDFLDKPLDKPQVAVLFSGGRDSSLAACLLALKGYQVHLLSFITGEGVKSEISDFRVQELMELFPKNIVGRVRLPIFGLVRKIAILNIESDFAKYKVNLILVGEKLAMHSAATAYCLQHNIRTLADGTSGYQSHFPEQMPIAIECLRAFESEYGIEYQTPILRYKTDDEVKYTLMEIGISTKSLEGITIFSESFSTPAPEMLKEYIIEKLPICKEYIKLLTRGERDS